VAVCNPRRSPPLTCHPDTNRKITPPSICAPAGGRRLHFGHAQKPVLRPYASNSCSTANTRPATTRATVDWKVWSKDRPLLHQAVRGENQTWRTTLVVDVSESMHYRPRRHEQVQLGCTIGAWPGVPAAPPTGRVRSDHGFDSDVRQSCRARSQNTHTSTPCAKRWT